MKQIKNLCIVTLFVLLATACGNKIKTESSTPETDSLIVVTKNQFATEKMVLKEPEIRPFNQIVKCNGKLISPANATAKISAVIPGLVEKIHCVNGQNISRGQVLFSISGNELIEIQRDYSETASQLKRLKSEYERSKELYNQKVATEKEFIQAESEYKAINARYSALEMKISLMYLNPQQIEEGNFSSSYQIKAPIGGQITRIDAAIGQYSDLQDYLAEITDNKQLSIKIDVFENDARYLQKGQPVMFNLLDDTVTYSATLETIGNTIDIETKTSACYARIDQAQSNFINNSFVNVKITTESDSVQAVPLEAIIKTEFGNFLLEMVKEDADNYYFEKIKVTTGRINNDFTEITSARITGKILWSGAYNLNAE
jgi:cobalt-zinc-cadmium efflux system membrane fusion protein